MFDETKRWAQARMDPRTWDRLRNLGGSSMRTVGSAAAGARRWVSIGSEHVTDMRAARFEPWRLIFAAAVAFFPALLLSLVDLHGVIAIPIVVLLIAIGISTYVADWVGGVTALVVSVICLDLFFIGQRQVFDAWETSRAFATVAAFIAGAAPWIVMIEHLKYDRARARLEVAALRAANTALSAVEIAAAQRPPGDKAAYLNVLSAILEAMVRVNRASVGALYLVDGLTSSLVRAAVYGDEVDDELSGLALTDIDVDAGFAGRIARERRPIAVFDTRDQSDLFDVIATNAHIRSVVGVPLIDPADRLVGVAWVGLYLPYRFGQTAIARLHALASRTTAFMEAARLVDDQDELLDRVQDHYRRLQAVIQTIPEAVMVARPPHGTIVASNAAAQRMFGVNLDGPPGSRRADRLRVVGGPEATDEIPIVRALREGVIITGVELSVRLTNGTVIPVVAAAAPLWAEDGTIDAVVGIFQDVGPLKEAERLRDEFVSVVSHELRSPLTPIRGFAQIVARDLQREGGHEQHVTWLNNLQQQVDRITRLVDDLLDVSRLRAGRLKIVRTRTDLNSVCTSVAESWNAAAQQHRIVLDAPDDPVIANVDGDRIHQVLDNLVGNAVKYADPGAITIRLAPTTGRNGVPSVEVAVTDVGPGISLPDQEAVFTPFYRARSATESAVPGLGLGLYISSELVQEHGGMMTVTTTPEGGSSFVIEIPLDGLRR